MFLILVQGRPFAWQEAQIALAILIQRFDFVMADPSYELDLKQSLTIKPAHFYVHAIPRDGGPQLLATPTAPTFRHNETQPKPTFGSDVAASSISEGKQPMYALYGSNTGTSEGFAQRIANAAASYGMVHSSGSLIQSHSFV